MHTSSEQTLIQSLAHLSAPELRRLLTEHLTCQKLGLYWERDAIAHDRALNADVVLPRLVPEWSHTPDGCTEPDVMIFPQDIALESSVKNIYGVLPPTTENAQDVESVLFMDERHWWADQAFVLDDGAVFSVGRYDGAVKLNGLEQSFARALDEADFVHWWHRNPDKKPYSARVVRAEHGHYFYPDFVVCVTHQPGEAPMQRLLETKESTKDAARKSQHFPVSYGKVLFLTPDGNRLRWVNDDGSLGEVVKLTELQSIHEKLTASQPVLAK